MSNMQGQPNQMWSGRFREPLNRTFEQWQRSLPWRIALVTLLVVTTVANAQKENSAAQPRSCSQSTIDRLESKSDSIRNWSGLEAFYLAYRVCNIDDAEITEGVSESVARMFADHWASLPTAQTLFRRDPAFEKFALAGLNITDSTDDLNRIDKLAANHCPSSLNGLCQKIRKAIRDNN